MMDCLNTKFLRFAFLFTFLLPSFYIKAQDNNTTIQNEKKTEAMLSAEAMLKKQKVLIIPFDPKMYMSEIDKKVNAETKLSAKQIYSAFREGLDDMLYLAIKQKTSVYSFLNDSVKNAKDMQYTYAGITYSYDPIPPDNASRKELNKPVAVSNEPKIVNGQLMVQPGAEKKFMKTKVTNPKLIDYLSQKYGASVFVFINELDIKNDPISYDAATDTYKRIVTVHYTIVDKDGSYLAYGVATSHFSSALNDPQKITKQSFEPVAKHIADKLTGAFVTSEGASPANKPKNSPKFH